MAPRTFERSHPNLTLLVHAGELAPRSGPVERGATQGDRETPAREALLTGPMTAATVRDVQVEEAIERMRAQLSAPWTVTKLARSVGLSRPAFARRFAASTGMSPLKFLTRCRMERAAELLRSSDLRLAAVGELVGYSSEFAFNRAFKRHHQVAPGSYRRTPPRAQGSLAFRMVA